MSHEVMNIIYFSEVLSIFSDLLNNAILLFGLTIMYAATNYREKENKKIRPFILGVIIGAISILVMRNSWLYYEGIFFDARSVLHVITGLFFGPITTIVSAVIAITYRATQGGSGVYSGVLTIITMSMLGLSWRHLKKLLPTSNTWIEYYVLGLVAHIITITCFLAIRPFDKAIDSIEKTIIPFLIMYPIVTMFLAKTVHLQKERIRASDKIITQQLLLQASIDSTKAMEVFAVDCNYEYLSFNEYHEQQMYLYYGIRIEKGKKFIDYITNDTMKARIQSSIDTALKGEFLTYELQIETENNKYVEEHYSPIVNDKTKVIGVTIFSQNITERKQYEQSILYLSYKDPLTNLYNRRYYTDQLQRLIAKEYLPLTVMIVDINGLKIMNDTLGHDAGDALLCMVADELIAVFKDEDHIFRMGGGEFVILLPKTKQDHVFERITQTKQAILNRKIQGMSASVSFGVATYTGDIDIKAVIKLAENDLYSHKLFEMTSHRSETIKTIMQTLHEKNPREEMHSNRVATICQTIGKALGMRNEEIGLLHAISNLHDIGKIAIDDAILNKPGKLDDFEWEQIKRHPEIGYRILSTIPEYSDIALDILSHHERYDGKGYPRGLEKENIPIRARIISVADAYDAMVSERPYRKPLNHQQAIAEIKKCRGTQFDPKVTDIFISIYEKREEVI